MNTDTEYYNLSDLAVTLNGIVRRLERMEQAITDLSQNFTPKTVQNENFKEYSVRNIETGLGGDIGGGLRRGYKGETLGGGKKGGKGFENAPGEVSTKVVQKATRQMKWKTCSKWVIRNAKFYKRSKTRQTTRFGVNSSVRY
jgi:hypothetical protein